MANTGDWCGEIANMLTEDRSGLLKQEDETNCTIEQLKERVEDDYYRYAEKWSRDHND